MRRSVVLLLSILFSAIMTAENLPYSPTPKNLERRKEFANSKFGIFVHWGIYSMMGDGEWVMTNQNIKHKNYSNWLPTSEKESGESSCFSSVMCNISTILVISTNMYHCSVPASEENSGDLNKKKFALAFI